MRGLFFFFLVFFLPGVSGADSPAVCLEDRSRVTSSSASEKKKDKSQCVDEWCGVGYALYLRR